MVPLQGGFLVPVQELAVLLRLGQYFVLEAKTGVPLKGLGVMSMYGVEELRSISSGKPTWIFHKEFMRPTI